MNIKTLFLVCFLLTFFNIDIFGQAKDKIAKVVIDAGHGGGHPGAVGKLCEEKEINLKVALRIGELISQNFDDVTVIYTRKKDETVDLYKRADIANKNKADLFISIHCNSVENNKTAGGVETFVMGIEKSAESAAVAKKENADMLLEKDYQTNYSGFDPNSPEANIIFSLYSSAYLNWSTILASRVQKHLVANTKMTDRSVRQGKIWVLYKVAMPSILIELGFISNPEEEKYLLREDTQELLAVSIYNAFVEYKNLVEGTLKPYLPIPKATKPTHRIEITEKTEIEIPSEHRIEITEKTEIEIPSNATNVTADSNEQTEPSIPKPDDNNIRFRIQFFISKDNLNTSDKKFSSITEVKKYYENGVWKYTAGDFKTLEEAQDKLKEVKKYFSDAFIIAFNNEQKISVAEAQQLLK
ncbi:MAG: N-acetylmuramoyl-L-alanine amidase [Bacteroidetes bacterium]|nr:N-acetylmuramoyl-L-alanine amidase [Bacteroidota bacterium]MCL1967979.1 N-acetylmuramoyl-L-alanine amidase [Bacteroidota bacterium]